jgi:hypothetical protein
MNDRSINYEAKQNVYKRANGCCEYCLSQARYSTQSFSIDHIIPVIVRVEIVILINFKCH